MTNTDLFSGSESAEAVPPRQAMPAAAAPLFQAPLFQAPDLSKVRAKKAEDTEEPETSRRRTRTRKSDSEDLAEKSESPKAEKNTRKKSKSKRKNDSEAEREEEAPSEEAEETVVSGEETEEEETTSTRRRRRRRSRTSDEDAPERDPKDEVTALEGSTRLEAKRQRRKEGRKEGRKKTAVTESEFLARREAVDRLMVVRERDGLNQIAVIEDGLLVEHYVARRAQTSKVGNVYVGKIQNVLPSMEAAFVDIGEGRNGVLYAGEVNWDIADAAGKQRRIEKALSPGDSVLVQVTKDPIGHKGARLTSQITLAGRYLVLVPSGQMTGISRKLPEKERARLKKILRQVVPKGFGVIVRTAAEGATEEQLRSDVERLQRQWTEIEKKQKQKKAAPYIVRSEPELAVRVVRDIFNEDFNKLIVAGDGAWETISEYVSELSPELSARLEHYEGEEDVFAKYRVDQQLAKGMDRKAWLPSGGSLVIDRTEAMTVIDVNTGRYTGAGGTLEETVTRNNLEAAEEIVRQLRLRDIGGIIVIDFVDMVLESNRDLVLRRLVECLGRDRTRHQVSEVTALGLVQMTRKRVGQGLVEAFSTECECCGGRGFIVHDEPIERERDDILDAFEDRSNRNHKGNRGRDKDQSRSNSEQAKNRRAEKEQAKAQAAQEQVKAAMSAIAAAANKDVKDVQEALADADVHPETAPEAEQNESAKREATPNKRNSKSAKTSKERGRNRGSERSSASGEQSEESVESPKLSDEVPAKTEIVSKPLKRGRRRAASTGVVTAGPQETQASVTTGSDSEDRGAKTTVAAQQAPTVRLAQPRRGRRRAASMGNVNTGD
ncbi:hypothetical protein BSR29_08195 [Boudabousia liubingyangii]|uniref:Ribonuclease E n=1 Tax=Boudabousia liubingyangii TaxID=1921764 RepID=A0A1Q5PJA1_9ACTO|nr:Rne/Rng family ribonuclease [Boudabousia liubingyangii]OKL45954.1 hypothetical protein BSR29_08195 [Boudabousia liubingyangii]